MQVDNIRLLEISITPVYCGSIPCH